MKARTSEQYLELVRKRSEVRIKRSVPIESVAPPVVNKTKRKPGEVAPGAIYVRRIKKS